MILYIRYAIMKSCWTYVPQDRPTFAVLQDDLGEKLKEADSKVRSLMNNT